MSLAFWIQIAFWCALIPAMLCCWNLLLYREPPRGGSPGAPPAISVLIPARDEERNIAAAVASVLASTGIELELIVLDDGSTDGTSAIVQSFAARDSRLRCVAGPPLPAGWAGKAHAAHTLAGLARFDLFCFLDADVQLAPEALRRMALFLEQSRSALVSGFPREVTGTFLERLLLPLIHFLLLGYLPLAGMRAFPRAPGFAAGCGQFLLVRREAYERTGGYAAVRRSMHDGMTLSKLFRRSGYCTDLADLTHLVCCRMYRSAGEVWNGLLKNATEGLAAPARIVPFTALLVCGQVLPWALLIAAFRRPIAPGLQVQLAIAVAATLLPRVLGLWRFRQSATGAILHPFAILLLLALQWWALVRKLLGIQVIWKERNFSVE